ncbi:MAG TPA: hypothetical protein VKB41_02890 [Steroidobacteraceae bacterium]|nr:hypothetical protein [Steroidobacteraceae bacterium]
MSAGSTAVYSLLFICLCCVLAPRALAQYDVEPENPVWLRALLDLRVVRGGAAPSWTDSGPGKTRFGGRNTDAGFERVTRFALGQLAIEMGAALPWGLRAQVQFNIQPDIADDYDPWVVEALVRKEWGNPSDGWGVQTGLMTLPFSLEHTGPAWTPEYSISASALNSWLWEEVSLTGLEGEWWHQGESGPRIGIVVGAGYGADQMGRLIASRGWALGDGVSGVNADLPLPNGTRMDIFNEKDHRPAVYTWLTLGDEARAALKLGYLDNLGDQGYDGVWHTRVATVGATLHPLTRTDFVVQYLRGKALVWQPTNDSSLRGFYALVSHHYRGHRVTVRYDDFRVHDLDGGNPTAESGDAVTLAYLYEWGLRHRVGAEYIWLHSNRPASAFPEPGQDGWQLSYRFRY